MTGEKIIIDAGNGVLGRIASYTAKQLLLGRDVVIVNCNNALLLGRRRSIIGEYLRARDRIGSSLKGPQIPKEPSKLFKRTIRGMLSHKQQRGMDALKKVRCYPNVPKEYESSAKKTFIREIKTKSIKLSELEQEI